MDGHSHTRFSETPPDSPKSCMKGSRRLTFDESAEQTESSPSPKSPKRSVRTVQIKSPGSSVSVSTSTTAASQTSHTPVQKPMDIEFQFNLTQHYDQSTPPPNCTSNGAHDYEEPNPEDDPRKDPQLAEIASKFVNEIIEKAKVEVANREKADQTGKRIPPATERDFFSGGRTPWYRRAHGAISKWVTNLCVRAQNSLRT